jgi:adenylyl-sulfate kinase
MSRQPGRGAIIWLTGMSGAGKSTVAQALKTRLERGHSVEILDGDEVREHLSKGLTFSKEDRDINVRRIGFVARLLAKHGVIVVTAAISPYEATRTEVRRAAERDGVTFVEVYANAQLQTLVDRDVKGLYKQALAGNLPHFTGVSDPYEAPTDPDVVVRSDRETVEVSVARVLDWLIDRNLIDRGALDASSLPPLAESSPEETVRT